MPVFGMEIAEKIFGCQFFGGITQGFLETFINQFK
jgi:hypothetical protein